MSVPFQLINTTQPFVSSNSYNGLEGIAATFGNVAEPSLLVCASLEGSACIVDLEEGGKSISRWQAHRKAITDIEYLASDPALLSSISRDGTVCLWDSRLPPPVRRICEVKLSSDKNEAEAWSVSTGGESERLLACSINNTIQLYDIRSISQTSHDDLKQRNSCSSGLICELNVSHSDIINVTRFHPNRRSILVTGGDDNLVVIHNTNYCHPLSESILSNNEDDSCIVGVFKEDAPPRLLNFIGPTSQVICTVSTIEKLAAWNCPSLNQTESFNKSINSFMSSSTLQSPFISPLATETTHLEEFDITPLISSTSCLRSYPDLQFEESAGYIVGAFYDDDTRRLFALGGSINGDLLLFHMNIEGCQVAANFITSSIKAHHGIIRTGQLIRTPTKGKTLIITGGEEGCLSLWIQGNMSH